jgi:hypothetical protein
MEKKHCLCGPVLFPAMGSMVPLGVVASVWRHTKMSKMRYDEYIWIGRVLKFVEDHVWAP